jgi:hypothetical protein
MQKVFDMSFSLLTWENIRRFDEIVTPNERNHIQEMRQQVVKLCPYLKQDGLYFYYCSKGLTARTDVGLNPNNPMYRRHVDLVALSMHCFDDYERCRVFRGNLDYSN